MKKLTGSIVALVTPFHEDGSVDFARLRELCDWHIANGTDAILALGTTGETASTSLEEDIKTLECVIDHVNGRVPVIAGAGSNSSEMQKHKSVIYSQMGASALLCISPYYVKTNEEGMYRHFMMSADAATAPIILYNVPGRTGCKISPDVVRRLSVHPNVMPRTVHDMVTDYLAGRHEKALQTQLRYLDLINALFMEVNPIPVKTAMNLMGLQAGHFRMPMYPMAPENLGRLKRIMREAGLPVQEDAE